jgi:hypothetical protein
MTDVLLPFQHRHAAHCESGVVSNLLTHAGLPMSEAMAFGISGAFTFAHMPFPKVNGFPLTSYRKPPGLITKRTAKRLGIRMHAERHRDPEAGMRALDRYLGEGRPVGLQASVFWLPYFPPDMRFHFNAHHMIAYGRDAGGYLLSDPVFETPQHCPGPDLSKARSVRGWFAPKNLIFYPEAIPTSPDLPGAVQKALRITRGEMLTTPLAWFGIRGIRHLAKKLQKMSKKELDPRWVRMFVATIVRMQEEIGTGGGGFRFMYASFLEEAAAVLEDERCRTAADLMTKAGDSWRQFALAAAQMIQQRSQIGLDGLADQLELCAKAETDAFSALIGV